MTKADVAKILIVKSGNTNPAVRTRLGDYDAWFVQTLGREGHAFDVLSAHEGAPLPPDARRWSAILVTGSPSSVTENTDWMRRWGGWLVNASERRVPVLAVCFGHQLLARTLGAVVRRSPKGREIGTVTCTLTEAGAADPLFEGVPTRFEVNTTHEDVVEEAPSVLKPLATNDHTALQAFASGDYLRGVQFHPEIDAAVMRAIVDVRKEGLECGIRPTPCGRRILENFIRHFARRG